MFASIFQHNQYPSVHTLSKVAGIFRLLACNGCHKAPSNCHLGPLEKRHQIIIFPRHEISNNLVGATSKTSDQPAHQSASRTNILC